MAPKLSINNNRGSYRDQEPLRLDITDVRKFMLEPTVLTDPEATWQQQLDSTRLQAPMAIPVQYLDVLGSDHLRHDSEQDSAFQSDYNRNFFDDFVQISSVHPNQYPMTDREDPHNSKTVVQEDVRRGLNPLVEVPEMKRACRQRASEKPEGWVASKNLISERKRREKLRGGLLKLRSLVPKVTKMDKISILSDTIDHVQELMQRVEILEDSQELAADYRFTNRKRLGHGEISGSRLEVDDSENIGDEGNKSSMNGSCSWRYGEEACYDLPTDYALRDWSLYQVNVSKLDHGIFKMRMTCKHQAGMLVRLSQAIELFVVDIVYTNIVVISSTKVSCTFIVKMLNWNSMTLDDVKADVKQLLGQAGLHFSQ